MSFSFNVSRVGISFVIMCTVYKAAVNSLPELSPQQYFSTLQAGKASLAYFYQAGKYFLYYDFYDISIAVESVCSLRAYCWISNMCYSASTTICLPQFKS